MATASSSVAEGAASSSPGASLAEEDEVAPGFVKRTLDPDLGGALAPHRVRVRWDAKLIELRAAALQEAVESAVGGGLTRPRWHL